MKTETGTRPAKRCRSLLQRFVLLAVTISASSAWAQTTITQPLPPQKTIPPTVLLEMRLLEQQFDQSLLHDCAPERCVSKGCVYGDHVVVDLPRGTSLPGIQQDPGPGAVPSQEYLTSAHCDFAYEKSVSARDVNALTRRLEQRLSKGWLKVSVGKQQLEPVSASLAESPPPKPDPVPAAAKPPEVKPAPEVPPHWDASVALRELWLHLLPHFAWMIAIFLGTLAVLALIWAGRRLGRETLEEKMLAAELAAGQGVAPEPPPTPEVPPGQGEAEAQDPASAELDFVAAQQKLWQQRIAQAHFAEDEGGVVDLLREWLKAREFNLLAKAIFVFGDRLSLAFSSDGELAMRKVEFAEFLKSTDESALPTDAEFFRALNHHSISAALLSQADADIYRSLREEFGSSGVVHLIESMPPRQGAVLFGLVPPDFQREVARTLSPELRLGVASQLLLSNRLSNEERRYIFDAVDAAREGAALPAAPEPNGHGILDRGREFDAAGALSALLPLIDADDRQALFQAALERTGGFPLWYENILYPDMLLRVPEELQADLLLEVDLKGLAGWSSVQSPAWQEGFLGRLTPTMQNAVRANMAFASRSEQLKEARRGHDELVSAVKRLVARGKVSFPEIVA